MEEILVVEKQRALLLQNLIRRGYIVLTSEELGFEILENINITDKGEDIIIQLKSSLEDLNVVIEDFDLTDFENKFQEFWSKFPTSDKYAGFSKTRILRTNEESTKKTYRKLLKEYNHEDIIKALECEIRMRQNNSITSNSFSYMKTVTTWLNQKEFISILESIKEDNIEVKDIFSRDV